MAQKESFSIKPVLHGAVFLHATCNFTEKFGFSRVKGLATFVQKNLHAENLARCRNGNQFHSMQLSEKLQVRDWLMKYAEKFEFGNSKN